MRKNFERGTRFGELFDVLRFRQRPSEVARIASLTQEQFERDFALQSRPFVLPLRSDAATGEDQISAIDRAYGERAVKVRLGDYADPEFYAPERRVCVDMTLSKYISQLGLSSDSPVPPYAGNFTLPREFLVKLGAEIPAFHPEVAFEPPAVWLGAKGCTTALHRDSTDNFTIHLLGRKRWTIFPPQDAPFLYMRPVAASNGGDFATSDVDLRKPDGERFPLFAQARSLKIEVEANEMLYVPMGWAHYVENLSTSLMVNYWLSIAPIGIAALAKMQKA